MKQLFFFFTFFGICLFSNAQELSGVWLSSDNPLRSTPHLSSIIPGKTIMDIDGKGIGSVYTRSKHKLTSNRKKTKFKIKGVKGKFKVEDFGPKELILRGPKNNRFVFSKLNLSHKVGMNEKELQEFLVEQQCDLIQGIQGKFTLEQFFKDKKAKKPRERHQFINFNERSNGYWTIKKIRGNALFIFEAGQNQQEGIFQITKVKVNGFALLPLLKDNPMKGLTAVKTCL